MRQDTGESELKLTAHGYVGGTPAYIAPEQALGKDIDARADIYQLGRVAYWMLTGGLVFEGDTALKTMMMHVQTPPERPSFRTEQYIPDELDQLILTCLAKDPASRPQTADHLDPLLARCGVREPWREAQGRRWWETLLPDRRAQKEVEDGSANSGRAR